MENSKEIVNATLSNCCYISVSTHNGKDKSSVGINYKGNLNFHYTCNKCNKECTAISVPYWETLLIIGKNGFKRVYKKLTTI